MTRLIRGGRVVTATDQFDADVLIDGETIVAVGTGLQGDEEIDASGCFVMPGLIDNHTHLSMPFGGTWSCDDYDTGTAAAAAGGTTATSVAPRTAYPTQHPNAAMIAVQP